MKLRNCNKCSLCKKRLHTAFGKGKKPASVMIIFGVKPKSESLKEMEKNFLRNLNFLLKYDWYKTYAIKCAIKDAKVNTDNIKKCRVWLKKEFEIIDPYLIILVGKIAATAVLGIKKKDLKQNVFWMKNGRKFFITESIYGSALKLELNLKRLLNYIQGFYHG